MEYVIHNQKFAALLGICEVIEQALDLERTLENILGILSDQLSMQRATITLYDPETGQLSINASHGLSLEEKRRGVYNLNEGITGRIFQSAEPYIVPDIRKEPHFLNKTGSRSIAKSAISFLGVPILMHGEVVGVLNVDRLFTEDISYEEDIEFLKIVATLIAQFTSLNEKVIKREARLKKENVSLKNQISRENDGLYMVGKSSPILEVEQTMEKVAPTGATVIVLGESGVGKSHIAKNIHQLSD
ncbi:MAG: GAF domain-containing protein, partial [Thermodesulfobacteriota bacterium]